MRIAVIGLGMVSETHFSAISDLEGTVELAGVHSRRSDVRTSVAQKLGVRAYASIEEICADPHVDAVVLLTPPNARLEIVRQLADAGKHILMEKPVERSLKAAQDLVEICEAADVRLGVVFQHRAREAARVLQEKISSGALGELAMVRAEIPWWREQSYYDASGRGTYAQDGGGVMITQAIHVMDLMLSLTGPVRSVQCMQATTKLHDMEAEDVSIAGLRFENGAVGTVFATTASFPGGPESLTVDGTRASAHLEGGRLVISFRDGRVEEHGEMGGTGGGADPMAFTSDWHREVIRDFALAIGEGREPSATGRSALKVHALIDAMRQSAQSGATVEL